MIHYKNKIKQNCTHIGYQLANINFKLTVWTCPKTIRFTEMIII